MEHKIFTKNMYIRHAIMHLLRGCRPEKKHYIVDIDSYTSFSALMGALKNAQPEEEQHIILIKGNGIHSRVLSPLSTLAYDDCLEDIRRSLKNKNIPEWKHIRNHLSEMQEWSMMTSREMDVIRFMVRFSDITTAARELNSNNKAFYSRIRTIAKKLNLRSANDVRRLAIAEHI